MIYYYIYAIISNLLFFIYYPYIYIRKLKNKEDPIRYKEKFGINTKIKDPTKAKLIWIHAASVGESISVLRLIEKLNIEYDNIQVLMTTCTVNSAKLMNEKLPQNAVHQFLPVDTYFAVNKFLKYWQPDLAIWVESEIWPNIIYHTSKKLPIMLINARMSDRSFARWQKISSLSKFLLSKFSAILAQSNQDANRYEILGGQYVKMSGNLKYDSEALPADSKIIGELIGKIGQRPILLASSTHNNEEEQLAYVHTILKNDFPDLLTIIAPRHPTRASAIIEDIKKENDNLKIAQRSNKDNITEQTDIYLADTLGELGIFYRLAPIVFIGGSLIAHGGQNPLEPSRLHCSLLFGPHMENFSEIKQEYLAKKAAISVKDKNDLVRQVSKLLEDANLQEEYSQNALNLVNSKSGVVDLVIKQIKETSLL